jgi:type IX secretion system PorP/SprF family membrane protein
MNKILLNTILALLLLATLKIWAQQDPQYTHYTYNTMTVNPAYTGSRGFFTALSIYRDQWTGIEGAPKTISFGIDTPTGLFNGIGLSIIQDQLGPSQETYIDGNFSHQLILNAEGHKLSLGLKGGVRLLNLDWSKGVYRNPNDVFFNENIKGKLLPSIGFGAFYYSDHAYLGVSTPNIINSEQYDDIQESTSVERTHIFLIGGYVFDVNPNLKFKPSFFVKGVKGSPLSVDLSANFLINEKLNAGINYRWDDSVSAILGFQVSNRFNVGYAYDFNTTVLNKYSANTHEIFLRYRFIPIATVIKSPRFF